MQQCSCTSGCIRATDKADVVATSVRNFMGQKVVLEIVGFWQNSRLIYFDLPKMCESVFCKFTDFSFSLNQFYPNSLCVWCLVLFNRCSTTRFSSYVYCNVLNSVCGSACIFISILYEITQQNAFLLNYFRAIFRPACAVCILTTEQNI